MKAAKPPLHSAKKADRVPAQVSASHSAKKANRMPPPTEAHKEKLRGYFHVPIVYDMRNQPSLAPFFGTNKRWIHHEDFRLHLQHAIPDAQLEPMVLLLTTIRENQQNGLSNNYAPFDIRVTYEFDDQVHSRSVATIATVSARTPTEPWGVLVEKAAHVAPACDVLRGRLAQQLGPRAFRYDRLLGIAIE